MQTISQINESFIKLFRSLFSRTNRGILLDICVFVSSIFLPHLLTGKFVQLTRAPDEDVRAKLAVAIFFTMLLFLAPLGAMLKRAQFWERINEQNKKDQIKKNVSSFVFSPWFSFIWLLIIYAFVVVSWTEVLLRDSYLSSTWAILAIIFGGVIYCFIGAMLILDFFRDDYGPPQWKILDRAGLYGDDLFDCHRKWYTLCTTLKNG